MTFTKKFDGQELLAGLKASTLADAPKLVADLLSAVLGWIAGSVALLAVSNPILAILSGFIPQLAGFVQSSLASFLGGNALSGAPMQLSKAFDVQSLLDALKSVGFPDVEKLLIDDVQVLFDWINQSLAMGSALEQALGSIFAGLESLAMAELKKHLP